MSVYADSCLLHNEMGSMLYRMGHCIEALGYFRNALDIDGDFLRARENSDGVCNLLVERWHFRMLNDVERNEAFRCAIERAVRQYGCLNVLDIGCGTGILSMFAVRAGADRVFACDVSETMCGIALQALQANSMSEQVKLYHMMSSDLNVPDHLERVSLVVTETVDAGLLGEGIVPTVRHAWKHLLDLRPSPTQSRVIPSSAVVYGCLIECEQVRRQSRLFRKQLENIYFSQQHLIGSNHREFAKDKSYETEEATDEKAEPYTTERIKYIENAHKQLSEPFKLFSIDFNNPEVPLPAPMVLNTAITSSGVLDCVLVWFDLQLIDDIYITSSPHSERELCWEQAVYPVNTTADVLTVNKGDIIDINMSCTDTCLHVDVCLSSVCRGVNVDINDIELISRGDMEKLNDIEYQHTLCEAVKSVALETAGAGRSACAEGNLPRVIDLDRGIPTAGINTASIGICHSVLCCPNESTLPVIKKLIQTNNLTHRVTISQLTEYQTGDIVILDVLDRSGVFHADVLRETALLMKSQCCDRFVVVPQNVTIWAVCVSSPELRANSQVLGSVPTLGLDIARFINEYQVTTQVNLNLKTIQHTTITQPLPFATVNFCTCDPIRTTKCTTVKVTGHITAVAFWFKVNLTLNHTITTYTPHKTSHWRQAAVLLPFDVEVTKGQLINISFLLRDSCIDFNVEQVE
ncbi:protein arginine N-methyltransferase 9-like isoform X2 [Corticium candelabrum]|uniref:protein arginine N-methyltransferase 9-like isoform X2 n=1 Tax=Corticium candelabrum TaxID=121492 RepID=UPI002E26E0E8|nr:protein arginine N-methyltransferase 9-like isoform X2 [Corticium candelabrum]